MKIVIFFFVATLFVTCHGHGLHLNHEHGATNQIFPLRMKSGPGGAFIPKVSCASWRLGVEAHNIINWKTVPQDCAKYIGNYILGQQYREDSKIVCIQAYLYSRNLTLKGDGKDIYVFDIDETSLSNLPYYADHGFGVEPFNETLFNQWVDLGSAPALPESLKLYKKLLSLGIKIVFLTGRPLKQKRITAINLKVAGFKTYVKLICKDPSIYHGKTAVTYKSAERKKLEEEGYRIVGNIGDQWSDILGYSTGNRIFKLPDPLYYIS